MEEDRATSLIQAVYVLPSPTNLNQWYGEDPVCPLCPSLATLKHVLVGCQTSLFQGWCTMNSLFQVVVEKVSNLISWKC